MRRIIARAFSSTKHFLDQNYQNLTLESGNRLGNLENLCSIFTNDGINMIYVKSHFSNAWTENKKYCLDVSIERQSQEKIAELKQKFSDIGVTFNLEKPLQVPWFPRKISDLDLIGKVLLKVKDEANRDHPQFMDQQYRKRRDYIAKVALGYKMGEKIPDIPYSKEETDLWRRINDRLAALHQKGMSKRFLAQKQKLEK